MYHGSTIPSSIRKIALAAAVAAMATLPAMAWADDYAEVTKLLRAGKPADAIAKADQYLAAKPKDPQMRFLKGVVQAEAGRVPDAISTFTKLTEEYPELPEPYNNLAVLYAGQGQFEKARATLEAAIRTNPSYSTAHENLGDVYAKLASQAYSKALQLDATNTGLQPKLALIRELFVTTSKGAPAKAPPPQAAAPAPATPAPAPAVVAKAPAPAPAPAVAAPSPAPAPAAPAAAAASSGEVEAAVQAWANAWSAKDMGGYLGSYGKEFDPPGKLTRKAWEDERRSRILGKSRISVKIEQLAVKVNGNTATAKFKQSYSADSLAVSSRKTLDMVKAGDRWVIVRESTGG
ncbi:tetratricopeptide repeat protein [Caenimonas koreensis DSM 17982]|uniref:Tetratricopeptide repeat protein n=2 Tax=Caenimonas TaxID=763439 RepID=A0A844BA23_9BURK|nr:tetratricopeptide repeat protein [Caenimonas koreensis]MRD47381.1 tetratricopeptide repeat protein [Caenimonas koreensis DSM 17982]